MSVTAVIGNYNGEHLLGDCLASLAAQTLGPTAILVVDGESSDASRTVAEAVGATFIARENRGLGYLYNEGVAASETEFVFLANNDIAADAACLEQLVAVLERDDTAFAADAHQTSWEEGRTIHARTTLTSGRMHGEFLPGLHLDPNVPASSPAPTVCANGAAMLVRRSMYEELGGFDETFFMEWEDLDLCWRAWMNGWRTIYVPHATVRHRVGAATTRAIQPRRSASSHHNLVRFALKCLPLATAARVVLGEAARLPAHPRAVSAGLTRVTRELPAILRQRRRLAPNRALLEAMLKDHL
jgi:N-acetylglucosaminyl-diphospho-decaprenol L-rhamnosyltransferase